MNFFTAIVVFTAFCGCRGDTLINNLTQDSRQKRLLFYDEEGNLVKTFGNSLHYLDQNEDRNPLHWSFLNAFIRPLRPTILKETPIAYMIPVADAVIEHINTDPVYQNKLFILSTKDPLVEKNALCDGKRVPIPSPNLCNKFLNCWDGWAFEQECPDGLMFSYNGYCDYAHQVDCHNRKIKETHEPLCTRDFLSFVNKANCNEFFVCVNRQPIRFKCPTDLAYSEYLGVCDYASLVDCNATQESITTSTTTPAPTTAAEVQSTEPTGTPAPVPTSEPIVATTSVPIIKPNFNFNVLKKLEYNKESWTSTHVALSRQDAIRQLKLANIANIHTNNQY